MLHIECGDFPGFVIQEAFRSQTWLGNVDLGMKETQLSCAKRCREAHSDALYFVKNAKLSDQCECIGEIKISEGKRLDLKPNEGMTSGYVQTCGK